MKTQVNKSFFIHLLWNTNRFYLSELFVYKYSQIPVSQHQTSRYLLILAFLPGNSAGIYSFFSISPKFSIKT
jgi:hypothetical protein